MTKRDELFIIDLVINILVVKKQISKKYPFALKSKISWDQFVLLATEVSKLYKFPASITICQAGLETGRGTSLMVIMKNNYFGYMAFDKDPSQAKKYPTALDSIIDYLELITKNSRYSAVSSCKTPLDKIVMIQKCGYASDPLYIKKITGMKEWQP
jgi:flagellum-specific peptidoglycan hydrolase FlgJ